MRNTRFFAAVIALGALCGVGIAATGALAQPAPEVQPASTDAASPAELEAELKAFLAEVESTGRLPIGVNAAGDGPYGYVDADLAVVEAGKAHPDLEVFDADGSHIGWVVHGLEPMTKAAYEADPAGLRAAGAARVAELAGQAAE